MSSARRKTNIWRNIFSILGIAIFIALALSSATQTKVAYKVYNVYRFNDVKSDSRVVYNVSGGTISIQGSKDYFLNNVKTYDADIIPGDYNIQEDIKRTDVFVCYCKADYKKQEVKVIIRILYTIYDEGYSGNRERNNGYPSWISIQLMLDENEVFVQGYPEREDN